MKGGWELRVLVEGDHECVEGWVGESKWLGLRYGEM